MRPPLLAATCDKLSPGAAGGTEDAELGAGLTVAEPPAPGAGELGAEVAGAEPPAPGVGALPWLEPSSTAGDEGAPGGVPATTALGPMGIMEESSSSKKLRVAGSEGEVDISEKGNKDSSNTTWREMMILLEWRSRHR